MDKDLERFRQSCAEKDALGIMYLGNEGLLFGYKGFFFACDPYLSYYTDENCCTDKVRWVRRYAPPFEGKELSFVPIFTLSHAHFDHADPYTIASILEGNPKARFVFPEGEYENRCTYHLNDGNTFFAKAGEPIELGPLKIIPVPSAHEEFHFDDKGNYKELGYVLEIGPYRIFHAGDMIPYPGLEEKVGKVDVACLPVNGRSAYKRDVLDIIGNFTASEAIAIASHLEASLMIPLHFDLYDVNSITVEELAKAAKETDPSQTYHVFKPKEVVEYQKQK